MTAANTLAAPVSWGELIDKITILEIKREKLTDPGQRANVAHELEVLAAVRDAAGGLVPELAGAVAELGEVNRALWDIEDEIRGCERAQDFGPRFIELARAVYRTNDRRAALKRRINEAMNSDIVEEKSYAAY